MSNVKNATGIVTRNFFVKIVAILEKLPVAVLVVSCLSILGASFWVNRTFARPSASVMNQGRSSAFQGRNIQDPLREPVEANTLMFNTQAYPLEGFVPAQAKVLRVSFLYQCDALCPQLWLTFLSDKQEKVKTLIHHPVLVGLPWFHISENGHTFYQKNPTFGRLSEIAQASPYGILTEKRIASENGLESKSVSFMEDVEAITDQQFIITSREPLSTLKKWYRYTTLVDIDGIQRDTSGQVTFFIEQRPVDSSLLVIKLANVNVATIQ